MCHSRVSSSPGLFLRKQESSRCHSRASENPGTKGFSSFLDCRLRGNDTLGIAAMGKASCFIRLKCYLVFSGLVFSEAALPGTAQTHTFSIASGSDFWDWT